MSNGADFDVQVETLLRAWSPRIGRPTCAPGCSNCCKRMTVMATAPEALRLAESAAAFRGSWKSLTARLRHDLEGVTDPDEARNALLRLGPCVFLEGDRCGVHAGRPDSCRACHVWHAAAYCGRKSWEMCTPAELIGLRFQSVARQMLAELDAGRKPFWGYLLPAVWLADHGCERYLAGEDLSEEIDPVWLSTELIAFPARGEIEREAAQSEREIQSETYPFGQPRGRDAKNSEGLRPFRDG